MGLFSESFSRNRVINHASKSFDAPPESCLSWSQRASDKITAYNANLSAKQTDLTRDMHPFHFGASMPANAFLQRLGS
jgi:hypothetical protein